jgi:hypothetical protein
MIIINDITKIYSAQDRFGGTFILSGIIRTMPLDTLLNACMTITVCSDDCACDSTSSCGEWLAIDIAVKGDTQSIFAATSDERSRHSSAVASHLFSHFTKGPNHIVSRLILRYRRVKLLSKHSNGVEWSNIRHCRQ